MSDHRRTGHENYEKRNRQPYEREGINPVRDPVRPFCSYPCPPVESSFHKPAILRGAVQTNLRQLASQSAMLLSYAMLSKD